MWCSELNQEKWIPLMNRVSNLSLSRFIDDETGLTLQFKSESISGEVTVWFDFPWQYCLSTKNIGKQNDATLLKKYGQAFLQSFLFKVMDSELINHFNDDSCGIYKDLVIHYVLISEDHIIYILTDKEPLLIVGNPIVQIDAPIIPEQGLGGLDFDYLNKNLEKFKKGKNIETLEFGDYLECKIEGAVTLYMDKKNSKVFKISTEARYGGTLFEKIKVNMPIKRELDWINDHFKYNEKENLYYGKGCLLELDNHEKYIEKISVIFDI